jgi:hypothetical protein
MAVLVLAAPGTADAARQRDWRLASPDGSLTALVRFSGSAAPLQATVWRGGRLVLSSAIGLATATRCLPMGLAVVDAGRATVFERYRTVAGKRRDHRYLAHRLLLRFERGHSALAVELSASDDGFAYRATLDGPARRRVTGECSAFVPPPGAHAWLQRFQGAYELPYSPLLLRDAPPEQIGYPALLQLERDWVLISESDLPRGQPATRLELRAGVPEVLYVLRPHQRAGLRSIRTPWRVAVIGPLATIVESDLVDDLARPARPADWSWVRPGRVAWSWWSDSASPASLARQRQYVDFAARMGWEYVLVDAGWNPAWMPALTAYARRRHVRVLVWAPWDALRPPARRDALLSRWRSWGVAGVKLDYMYSDSHQRMRWYRGVARAAAKRRLVIDFHGSTAPRGLSRTWPNVLTTEAVVGAETYKSDAAVHANPTGNATLPFTRNAIGSMDYTPVTFSTPRRQTSDAHELALSVVFESGLQHFADSPESYATRPAARRWLRAVPAAWDETRLLSGFPGVSATIARRSGRRWFVGSITAGAGGTARLPLGFLFPGRRYGARIVEDAPAGGLISRTRRVTADRALRLSLRQAGGYVVRFTPVGRR